MACGFEIDAVIFICSGAVLVGREERAKTEGAECIELVKLLIFLIGVPLEEMEGGQEDPIQGK